MGRFNYKVKTKDEIIQGHIQAADIKSAATILENQGYIIIEIKEEKTSYTQQVYSNTPILTIKEKKDFFNTFYFLFKSGLSILEICASGFKSAINKNTQIVFSKIYKDIEKGKTIEETFKKYANSLGYVYSMLIIAGEKSGKLEDSLSGILKSIKTQEKLTSDIKKRMWYPLSLILMTLFVGLMYKFFFSIVFPRMMDGLTTQEVINILIASLIKIAIIFTILIVGIFCICKNKPLLNKIIAKFMKLNLIKNIMKSFYFTNFFSIFSLGYNAGLTICDSIELANYTINSKEISEKIKEAKKRIEKGCEVSSALDITGLFSEFAISQTATGEKSGDLDNALKGISLDYEKELAENIDLTLKTTQTTIFIIISICAAFVLYKGWSAYFSALLSF